MKKREYFIVNGKRIPTTKNVKYAAKKLPPEVQQEFLKIWELVGCMDLYGGYLPDYFQVIRQNMEDYHKKIKKVEEAKNMLINSLTAILKENED